MQNLESRCRYIESVAKDIASEFAMVDECAVEETAAELHKKLS